MSVLTKGQIAYLMADISDVKREDIREIADSLDALPCKFTSRLNRRPFTRDADHAAARIVTRILF